MSAPTDAQILSLADHHKATQTEIAVALAAKSVVCDVLFKGPLAPLACRLTPVELEHLFSEICEAMHASLLKSEAGS